MFDRIRQDLRFGLRALVRNPLFASIALVALTLGIGANSVILSAVNAVLLRPLPYADPDRLVRIWSSDRGSPRGVSVPDLEDWKPRAHSIEKMAAFQSRTLTLTGLSEPLRLNGTAISGDLVGLLGVEPLLGHAALAERERPLRMGRILVSYGFWQRYFNADPGVLGQTLQIEGQPVSIVGVMPPEFWFPTRGVDVWAPLEARESDQDRSHRDLAVIARLKPGVQPAEARKDLNEAASALAGLHPDANQDMGIALIPLREHLLGDSEGPLFILMTAVLLVLLITCANVANLLLARAALREREIAMRAAMGARRHRLMAQLLTESVLLALLGGLLGLPLADWALRLLASSVPADMAAQLPGFRHLKIDPQAFSLTMLLALFTGIVFGIVPALRGARTDLIHALKPNAGESGRGIRGRGLSRAMVICQTAAVLTLLITSSLAIRSFIRVQAVDPGFDPGNALATRLEPPSFKYGHPGEVSEYYRRLVERLKGMPEIRDAAASSNVPLGKGGHTLRIDLKSLPTQKGRLPMASTIKMTPDYFRTAGIGLSEGRPFTESDGTGLPSAIVNQALARRHWPHSSPLGEQIRVRGEGDWRTIVGVVDDVKNSGLVYPTFPEVYLPYQQNPYRTMYVIVRTNGSALEIADRLRSEIWAVDSDQPISEMRPLQDFVDEWATPRRLFAFLLGSFSIVAAGLALVGIYGLVSFTVNRQTRQIGIRMALGARPGTILTGVLAKNLRLMTIGMVLGLAGAWGFGRLLAGSLFLYGVTPTDSFSFLVFPALLLMAGSAAAVFPALRAARVEPVEALRRE